jgi:flagellar biosynthesis protein FlhF
MTLRNLQATDDRFTAVNPTAMVLTKLDEAAALGTMLSICRHVKLPVSYITTGQNVPNDIEPAHALRLTRLILGQDKLHSGPAAA